MFDWNDEELRSIIWGESGDIEHIVPYDEESEEHHTKKGWSQEAKTYKATESKTTGVKTEFNGRKLESSSNFNSTERSSASGIGISSWSDLSLSTAARADEEHRAVKAELGKASEIFQNSQGKDQGDFVDYSWDNIGSFDDLDRIFSLQQSTQWHPSDSICSQVIFCSNDDPLFGHVSLGRADELWSSKDATSSPEKFFSLSGGCQSLELGALKNTPQHVSIKSKFEQQDDQGFTVSNKKLKNPAICLQNVHSILDHAEYPGGKSGPTGKEQVQAYKPKNPLKGRKKFVEKGGEKLMQDMYGSWSETGNPSGKYMDQLAPPVIHSPAPAALCQQGQLAKSETLKHHHISSSFVTPAAYGNLANPYPAMPVLSHIQSGEFKHQILPSCYEISPGKANPVNKLAAATAKPLSMTPQEKIEKLRRRQQMQAMLAIQKQQQQFSHQVSPRDHSNPQKFLENPIQHVEGADTEIGDFVNLPSFDPNSPVEQDDSNTVYFAVDNYPVADTILYHLQDVIAKLDLGIRLCIRDSLFRLAQSAMQRHYASDTSSTNKNGRDNPEVVTEAENNPSCSGGLDPSTLKVVGEISSKYPRMPDAETETNPIDRVVAHLLFHRPLDLPGKHPETPESPASTKFPCEHATINLLSLPMESSNIKQNLSHQGSENPNAVAEPQIVDQLKTSPCIDSSENASNYGAAGSGAASIAGSQ